jgi:hypothetical protein
MRLIISEGDEPSGLDRTDQSFGSGPGFDIGVWGRVRTSNLYTLQACNIRTGDFRLANALAPDTLRPPNAPKAAIVCRFQTGGPSSRLPLLISPGAADLKLVRCLGGYRAHELCPGALFALKAYLVDFLVGQTLNADEGVMGFADSNELI